MGVTALGLHQWKALQRILKGVDFSGRGAYLLSCVWDESPSVSP